ncbi:MAG: 4-hydroxy-tetrahydrodipicolinate synthase [Pseudomonadales bacterium]|nr:4-hydroxy-tetrahydrodipicolinate synthase [Pseudomonadales bacterium]
MITGSIVALVTPMDSAGEVQWDELDQLVEFHVQQGTDAIVAVGTTGESATLEFDEHCEIVQRIVNASAGRIPVIAGTGANSTKEAVDLTSASKYLGVDACLLVTPYYNKPTQEGLYQHFKQIAEAVDVPQILYNVPGRTACDMLPETVERLASIKNIIVKKEATGDLDRGLEVIKRCQAVNPAFMVYSGDDPTAIELMLLGAKGNISVTANVAPKTMSQACAAALVGDADKARQLDSQIRALHAGLSVECNPIPVKWALHQMGKISAGIRLPLTPLANSYREPLKKTLADAGLL